MKKLLLSTLISLISVSLLSQSCLPEGIKFTSQVQIDNFSINYPGCTQIEGDVAIEGFEWYIDNVIGLSVLTYIGGDITINVRPSNNIISLWGFRNLDSIGGNLHLYAMSSLAGLHNLKSIGGDVEIYSSKISDMSGFVNLNSIGGYLKIEGNYLLQNLAGLENLISIGGSLAIANNSLQSLNGLDNLDASFITDLRISDNPNLSYCEIQNICDYLASPSGAIDIYKNATGCNNPSEIANACNFDIGCLPFGNYYFGTQLDIDNFQTNYPGCNQLNGNVSIGYPYLLDIDSLSGLQTVTSIEGNLWIISNGQLPNLSGLDNISNISGEFVLLANSMLVNLEGLGNLTSVGNISINNNGNLENFSGMDNLDSITYNLTCSGHNIVNFAGFEKLTYIGGSLGIGGNESLTNLEGFDSLVTIGDKLTISNNRNLTMLTGFEKLDVSSLNKLEISNNILLSACHYKFVCDFLDLNIGEAIFQNNASGCIGRGQVEHYCGTSVEDIELKEFAFISPNPFTTSTTLSYDLKQPEMVTLCIYNHLGQVVYQTQENQQQGKQLLQWNAEGYTDGIYYYRLQAGKQVAKGKMVKVR